MAAGDPDDRSPPPLKRAGQQPHVELRDRGRCAAATPGAWVPSRGASARALAGPPQPPDGVARQDLAPAGRHQSARTARNHSRVAGRKAPAQAPCPAHSAGDARRSRRGCAAETASVCSGATSGGVIGSGSARSPTLARWDGLGCALVLFRTDPQLPTPASDASVPFLSARAKTRSSRAAHSEFALVFAADDGYARPLAVAMHSALGHLSPDVVPEVYLLDAGLSASARNRLLRVADAAGAGSPIRWIRIPTERLPDPESGTHLNSTVYSPLLIPELLPPRVRRAVYLDADVLVRQDLTPLFTVELGDALVGAVRGYKGSTVSELGDSRQTRPVFNTGVLVMDLLCWRRTGLADRALEYAIAAGESLRLGDQDALNAVEREWRELDYRWNFQQTLWAFENRPRTELTDWLYQHRTELYRTAAILHFSGGRKPWHHRSRDPGTMLWVCGLMGSRWYNPVEAISWLLAWLTKRAVGRAVSLGLQLVRRRRPARCVL